MRRLLSCCCVLQIVGILLAVGYVAILFCFVALLIDRCLASFAVRVLQIAAGTPPAPLDAKVRAPRLTHCTLWLRLTDTGASAASSQQRLHSCCSGC